MSNKRPHRAAITRSRDRLARRTANAPRLRAFVLSGGANLGAIQVGMLHALYERDIVPDLIVGASVGAVNGAFLASRPQTVATAEELADVWRRVHRSTIFPLSPISSLLGLTALGNNLLSNRGLRRLVERELEIERLEDARVPLHIVAVDALTGREVHLSEGPAVDAVMASAAIPGVFPPIPWDGMKLIDGGVANNTPISRALALGASEVYVLPTILPTGDACALTRPPSGALGALLHATTLLLQSRLVADIAAYRRRARLVVLPPPCPLPIQPLDFGHTDTLISDALAKSRAFLDRAPAPAGALAHAR